MAIRDSTNGAYGISKKAVTEYALAVNKQFGLKVVNLLLTNLYGPGDDFGKHRMLFRQW